MARAFSLGQILATPGALAALGAIGQTPLHYLARHATADWGQLAADDKRANEEALETGARLLSSYVVHGAMCPRCQMQHAPTPVGATVSCARCGGDVALVADVLTGFKVWVITEAADDAGQRVATTVLLPEEY